MRIFVVDWDRDHVSKIDCWCDRLEIPTYNNSDRAIPLGWKVKKLREFTNTASGGTPLSTKSEYYEKGNIAWINSGEVNSHYITEANNFITQAGLDNSSAKFFEPNTLLVAMYGATAGKVSLLQIGLTQEP